MSMEFFTSSILRTHSIAFPSALNRLRQEFSHAQKVDKVLGVIALIGPQSFHPEPFSPLTFEHALGRLPLRAPGGLTDFKIDQKPVSVLHQGVRPVTELSLFSRPLAHQKTVGIGGGLMGVVAALLTMKIHPAVSWISLVWPLRSLFSFGMKAFKACPRKIPITYFFIILISVPRKLCWTGLWARSFPKKPDSWEIVDRR